MDEKTKRLGMVQRLIEGFGEKAEKKDATVSDFVRLVGLEQEFGVGTDISKIEVTWLAPSGTEKSG